MKHHVTSWNKRILAWVLSLAMVTGLLTTYIQTVAQNASQTEYVTGEPAMNAMKVIYEEDFGAYEDAALTEGDNEAYSLYVPNGVTAEMKDKRLSVVATADSTPLYILGGEMWGYYTLEADITYATDTAGAEVCFYMQNADKYVTASLPEGGSGDAYHVKLVANGTAASMSYATYVLGVQGDMSTPVPVEIAVSEQSGSVGFDIALAEGAETAAMYIDNITVTRNTEQAEAKHTLLSVAFDEYTDSTTMSASNTYDDYYIKTSATGITVVAEEQKLYVTSTGEDYGVMYFDVPDAVHWDNYVVEADVCQTNTEGWGSLLYRVQSLESFQSGGLHADGTAELKGYWHDWVNDGEDNGIYHEKATEDAVADNEIRRLRIVVKDDMADLYVASYTDNDNTNVPSEWQYLLSINDIADHHATGSVGFLVAEGAEYWIDNLDVYECTTTYYEDFNYEDATLTNGTTEAITDVTTGIALDLHDSDTTNSTIAINNQALDMTRTTADSYYALAWFAAGENWTNYTYEADILQAEVPTGYWNGLAYRVESRALWQRAALAAQSTNVLNRVGAVVNESIASDYAYTESLSPRIGFENGQKIRMKVVVKNNCTWIYTARYVDDVLEPYNLHMVIDSCKSFVGAAGMVVTGVSTVTYDNIVVSATSEPAGTTSLANIVEPQTGIVNPPTIVTQVDEDNYQALDGTAVAILNIDSNLDILGSSNTPIGSVSQFMNNYGDSVIPAFHIDSAGEVTAICNYLEKYAITDAFYVASDAALLKTARETWGFVRGILEYTTMPTDHAATRREMQDSLAMVAVLPKEGMTQDIVTAYNARGLSVWSDAADAVDVYKGIADGYNGLIASKPTTITKVYESITETTLSGKPIVIGHQGVYMPGSGYVQNTIKAYKHAIDLGATIVEMDVRKTSDNELILMHDATVNSTTDGTGTVATMTLEQIKALTVDGDEEPGGVPTLKEALEEISNYAPDVVMLLDATSYDAAVASKIKDLITKTEETSGYEDQVLILCTTTVATDAVTKWSNSAWGTNLPFIGGNLWISKIFDETTTKEEYISDMIHRLSRYNHQQQPFDYNDTTADPYGKKAGNNLYFYDEESLSYEVAARGFLNLQCTTTTEELVDKAFITQRGTTAITMNDPTLAQDYCYQIEAKNTAVKIGEPIDLEQTVKMLVGTVDDTTEDVTIVKRGVNWLSGDAVVSKSGNYTMNSAGEATFVYYADIEQTRNYGTGTLSYRIYSEPVTITWNETGFVCEHEWSTEYSYTDDNHYQVCTKDDCGATGNIAPHTEASELVGKEDATETEAGYTGDVVCATCGYVMDEGEEIPADPFAGYTTITPADFGIEDDTYTTATSCTKTPLSTFDNVNFAIEFSGQLKNWTGIVYGKANSNKNEGILLAYHGSYPGRLMIANNASSRFTMYAEDGTVTNQLYVKPEEVFLNGEYTTFVGADVRLNITTDLYAFNDDGEKNDLRVGFWFDGNLYKDQYYYLADITGGTYVLNQDLQIGAVGDPGVTIKSPLRFAAETSPLDGYNVITPLSLGVADAENATAFAVTSPETKTVSIDKLAFVANIQTNNAGQTTEFSFLTDENQSKGIDVWINTNSNWPRLYNRLTSAALIYVEGSEEAQNYISIDPSKANVTGFYSASASSSYTYELWYTLDLIDYDDGGEKNDLQLGVWFNGQLYNGTHFYIKDCLSEYQAYFKASSAWHISSPIMESKDVGLTAGEYMNTEAEFKTSPLTSANMMDEKTFETPIRFEGEGATFYYGSADDAVKFTSTADGIKVTHTYGDGETDLVTLNKDNVGIDVTKRSFDLKLTTTKVNSDTDSTVDDVKLDISVNGKVRSFYITDAADLLTAQAGVQCEEGAAVIVGEMAQLQPVKAYRCLDDENYVQIYDASTMDRLSLNGLAQTESFSLAKSGTYRIASTTNGIVSRSEVTTYRTNDVTGDDAVNIKDLVRMLKIADANDTDVTVETQTLPGRLAIGCLDVTLWKSGNNWTALNSIRKGLLNQITTNVDQTVLPEQSIQ